MLITMLDSLLKIFQSVFFWCQRPSLIKQLFIIVLPEYTRNVCGVAAMNVYFYTCCYCIDNPVCKLIHVISYPSLHIFVSRYEYVF
jgi:hypothetical protein